MDRISFPKEQAPMSEEDYRKYIEFRKNGQPELEENPKKICCPWTDAFAQMIQLFRIITEDMNFSKPFRLVIDYDPEQPRTVIHHYESFEATQDESQRRIQSIKEAHK